MESELFKVIFKLEGDNKELLASLDQVNSKYAEQNVELKKQQDNLKKLQADEEALIKGRAAANSPTVIANYNRKLEENKNKINECKKAMENLQVAEQKVGKTTDDLNKKIKTAFDATTVNGMKKQVEDLGKKIDETSKPVESLRSKLRKLKEQIANTDDDEEFLKLSIEAGKLEDKINDAREAAQIFATDSPFQAVGRGIRGVAADLLSMDFNGAAQKSKLLLDATKQITFKATLTGLKELGTTFLNIGKSLLLNPLFLIGATIFGIIQNFNELKNLGGPIGSLFRGIGEAVEFLKNTFFSLTDALGITTKAIDKLQVDRLENLKTNIERTTKVLSDAANLLRAGGHDKAAEQADKDRLKAIVKNADEQIKIQTALLARKKGLTDEQQKEEIKKIDETEQIREDALNGIAAIEIAADKKRRDAAKELNDFIKQAALEGIKINEGQTLAQAKEQFKRIKNIRDAQAKTAEEEDEFNQNRAKADAADSDAKQKKLDEDFAAKKRAEDAERDFEEEQQKKRRKSADEEFKQDQDDIAKKKKLKEEERKAEIAAAEQFALASVAASQQIVAAKITEIDRLTALQQKRVDDAKAIADKGNTKLLALEEKRLADLNQQRELFVKRQQQLATIELIANTAIAVSKAAAQGGVAAAFTIAAALIALTGGLIAGRSIASQAAYYEGGYTGDGDPRAESNQLGRKPYTYHKGEFVFDHKKTGQYRDIFEGIHEGHIDLNDWKNKVNSFESIKYYQGNNKIDVEKLEKELGMVRMAIENQSTSLEFNEHGLSARFKNIKSRQDFITKNIGRA